MVGGLNSVSSARGNFVVATSNMPTYKRAPSDDFLRLLKEGFLSPLLHLGEQTVAGRHHDVHLRIGDEVHVYRGLTRLVAAKRRRDGKVEVSASPTYTSQTCAEGLFGVWSAEDEESQRFENVLSRYLDEVCVALRHTEKEGGVQTSWSRDSERLPWTPFDREAVLSYESEQQASKGRKFTEVEQAHSLLKTIATKRPGRRGQKWSEPSSPGKELDQLAVDPKGNLVLIELKYAEGDGNSAEIYYSPLQLLQYIHEWKRALGWLSVWRDLQELIDARVALKIMRKAPKLTGGIRAAVCFGKDGRSKEVKRRYYETLGIVNAHLPSNVGPIETWKLDDGGEAESI